MSEAAIKILDEGQKGYGQHINAKELENPELDACTAGQHNTNSPALLEQKLGTLCMEQQRHMGRADALEAQTNNLDGPTGSHGTNPDGDKPYNEARESVRRALGLEAEADLVKNLLNKPSSGPGFGPGSMT